jgi:hypothetical protein
MQQKRMRRICLSQRDESGQLLYAAIVRFTDRLGQREAVCVREREGPLSFLCSDMLTVQYEKTREDLFTEHFADRHNEKQKQEVAGNHFLSF